MHNLQLGVFNITFLTQGVLSARKNLPVEQVPPFPDRESGSIFVGLPSFKKRFLSAKP